MLHLRDVYQRLERKDLAGWNGIKVAYIAVAIEQQKPLVVHDACVVLLLCDAADDGVALQHAHHHVGLEVLLGVLLELLLGDLTATDHIIILISAIIFGDVTVYWEHRPLITQLININVRPRELRGFAPPVRDQRTLWGSRHRGVQGGPRASQALVLEVSTGLA